MIYRPKHSLIDQSLHSQLGAETTNGDGFGIGWYGDGETPGVYHSALADRPEPPLAARGGDHERRRLRDRLVRGLTGAWNEVPESSYGVVQEGQDELHPFTPRVWRGRRP